ncbi:hypothetical protein EC957_008359 [Mortierella hygrophila]|uniref:RNA-dependent RNA polymerase n=1 Tax=Mortierella hygrophila TaxID=979708 RepID=A0A9P6FD05_9FUNG|nr:hypothetical protein EC957_008359 [Mortierella hygrophila]
MGPRSASSHYSSSPKQSDHSSRSAGSRHNSTTESRLFRLQYDLKKLAPNQSILIRIRGLEKSMSAAEIKELLEPYGQIVDVTIERPESSSMSYADVRLKVRKPDIDSIQAANIGGSSLDMEIITPTRNRYTTDMVAQKLELGLKLAQDTFCSEFVATANVVVQFQHQRRCIKIMFDRYFKDTTIQYHVEMKFQDMDKGSIQVDTLGDVAAVTIHLRYPPTYWRYDPNMDNQDDSKWSVNSCLRRVVDIPNENGEFTNKGKTNGTTQGRPPVEPNPSNLWAKLGKWTVIRFIVDQESAHQLDTFNTQCREFNLLTQTLSPLPPIVTQQGQGGVGPLMTASLNKLPFETRYMLESALSFNYIVDYELTPEVIKMLSSVEPIKAATILELIVASRERVWNLQDYLRREEQKLARISTRPRIVPSQCVFLRKVIVTPTTMYLQPPTVETSNRIIRHYSHLSDYFLRIEYSDEGNNKLWSRDASSNMNNAIFNRVFTTLTDGIKIGDRVYEFLAFSASQLRDNAAWFFCSKEGKETPDTIRNWMGDFSHIKSIAKYGARMGQCFSSTRDITRLRSTDVEMIDDIEHHDQNFSDGCGRISEDLARMIGIELEKETTPSAFQIRLGGAKGVLVKDAALKGNRVQIRPSMKKFDVAHYVLEVIKTSSFIPSFLNRQIIILLTSLGVPEKACIRVLKFGFVALIGINYYSIFINHIVLRIDRQQVIWDLKGNMVRDLNMIQTDDMMAIKLLIQNWDEGGTSKMLVSMIRAGFLQRQDPFVKNLLTLFRQQMLEELSKKARVYVPQGAYLLGVCDETGDLEEGEIFIQVSSVENPSKWRVIEGDCVVVRCPCFHPGDVRVVRAVKCPSLSHLHDVVVFNTKGRRGIPSMCSGGDLDGDDFTVIWDPNIVSNVLEMPPMDYSGPEAAPASDVTIRDILKFFVQYAVSDNLGLIANAHLAQSDWLNEGPKHQKCLRLAQLHSDAVDFPKSGKPAEITPDLRPKKYPDFMEKAPDRTYKSKRVIGRIYRECAGTESFVPKDYRQSFNEAMLIEGYEDYMRDGMVQKALYDQELKSLMNQYGVKSDLEVVSGFITGVDIITNKREYEIRRSIVRAFTAIRTRFRLELEQEFYAPDAKVVPPSNIPFLERKAAAWYAVCYQNLQPGQPYTFCWIAWDILCRIASRFRGTMMENDGGFGFGEDEDFVDGLDGRDIVEEPPHPPRVEIADHLGLCTIGPEVDDDLLSTALKF